MKLAARTGEAWFLNPRKQGFDMLKRQSGASFTGNATPSFWT